MDIHHKTPEGVGQVMQLLQAAVDHYPRLAAFRFTLQSPGTCRFPTERFAPASRADGEALARITLFRTEVRRCLGEYVLTRITAGLASPPTLLRWVWEAGALPCQMVLLFNLSTCNSPRCGAGFCEEELNAVSSLLRETWSDICQGGILCGITGLRVELNRPERFDGQHAVLWEAMLQRALPVSTACH